MNRVVDESRETMGELSALASELDEHARKLRAQLEALRKTVEEKGKRSERDR